MNERLGSQQNASLTLAHMRRWTYACSLRKQMAVSSQQLFHILFNVQSSNVVGLPFAMSNRSDIQTRTGRGRKGDEAHESWERDRSFLFAACRFRGPFLVGYSKKPEMSEMVQLASPAQHTFPLLFTHDIRSILLELLELSPRHGVLRLLFEGVSHWTGAGVIRCWGISRRT